MTPATVFSYSSTVFGILAGFSVMLGLVDLGIFAALFAILCQLRAMDARQTVPQRIRTDTRAKRAEVS